MGKPSILSRYNIDYIVSYIEVLNFCKLHYADLINRTIARNQSYLRKARDRETLYRVIYFHRKSRNA